MKVLKAILCYFLAFCLLIGTCVRMSEDDYISSIILLTLSIVFIINASKILKEKEEKITEKTSSNASCVTNDNGLKFCTNCGAKLKNEGLFCTECDKKAKEEAIVKDEKTRADDDYISDDAYEDPLFQEIAEYAIQVGKISASLIQRKYRLGYNRVARIIDLLEERGVIGPANGSMPRIVLIDSIDEILPIKVENKNISYSDSYLNKLDKEQEEKEYQKYLKTEKKKLRRDAVLELNDKYREYLNLHKSLNEESGVLYSVAAETCNASDIIRCMNVCFDDIKIAPTIKEYYNELEKITGEKEVYTYNSFKRLALIYEKEEQYEDAINVCQQAIDIGFVRDGTTGQMYGRLARLKKLNDKYVNDKKEKLTFNDIK